jgi:hypothetical protein
MNLRAALATLALVSFASVACSSPTGEDATEGNQNIGEEAASTDQRLSEGDRLASEVILRQVLDGNLLAATPEGNPNETIRSVLEGSGDAPEAASVLSVSCESSLGTKTCQLQIGVELKNPGPNDDHGYHTVYGLDVDLRAGKILRARWSGLAG